MPGVDPVSLAVESTIGGIESAVGLINSGKAKKEAERLSKTRPKRSISKYAKDDLALSESELQQGMSADAERAYENMANKQLSTSLSAILKGGGSVNNVGDVYGKSEEGRANLAILKDQARMSRVNNVIRSYQMMNEEEQANFAFNEFAPWADKSAANAEARKEAQGQIWKGVNTLGAGVMQYSQDKTAMNAYDKYFKTKDQPAVAPSFAPAFGGYGEVNSDFVPNKVTNLNENTMPDNYAWK